MAFLKWLFLISFLAVILTDSLLAFPHQVDLQIDSDKFSNFLKSNPELLETLQRIRNSDQVITAEANEFTDKLFEHLNEFILNLGVEPFPMPGLEASFLLGSCKLNDGKLQGISTLIRQGNVKVSYENLKLSINVVFGLDELTFDYHYEAKLLGLGPSGRMEGKSDGSKVTVALTIDLSNLQFSMDKFDINTIGKITLRFRGSITGQIINILTGVLIPLLKPIMSAIFESVFRDVLVSGIGAINTAVCQLLGDCPIPAPVGLY